jgi:hypothetical protein
LSRLPEELADAACRLASGGGFGGRQLYRDHDEAAFDAIRPLMFNAIPELGAARPDFLDRVLIVEFLTIKAEIRRDEAQFWHEFSEKRPWILGALLDAMAAGLRNIPQIKLEQLPRLADFAQWVSACEEVLGMKPGEPMTACRVNCTEVRTLAFEAFPLTKPLGTLAETGFRDTMVELLARLNILAGDHARRSRTWPRTPSSLGTMLRRMAGNLRLAGIEVEFNREHGGRRIVSIKSSAIR